VIDTLPGIREYAASVIWSGEINDARKSVALWRDKDK